MWSFWGIIVGADGIRAIELKIQAIGELPTPKTMGENRLAKFYRMFIHGFNTTATLFMECLKKRKFKWVEE